ncbi:hypothetical protein KAI58_01340 [Candidatus Gracilibacteria bacterium]|nr:hypothetical protein [Candidatus Gracilibacteria bacterium]
MGEYLDEKTEDLEFFSGDNEFVFGENAEENDSRLFDTPWRERTLEFEEVESCELNAFLTVGGKGGDILVKKKELVWILDHFCQDWGYALHTCHFIEKKYGEKKRHSENGKVSGKKAPIEYHLIGTANLALKILDAILKASEELLSSEEKERVQIFFKKIELITSISLFHDFVEDGMGTLEDIEEFLVSSTELIAPQIKEVLEVVELLTRKEEESLDSYLEKIKQNPLAWFIKLADFLNNGHSSHEDPEKTPEKNKLRQDKNIQYTKELLPFFENLAGFVRSKNWARILLANPYLETSLKESLSFTPKQLVQIEVAKVEIKANEISSLQGER